MRRSLLIGLAGVAFALLGACTTAPPGLRPPAAADTALLTLPSGRTVTVDPEAFAYTGTARLRWPDGREYEGQWLDGRPHGRGTEREPDGSVYTGSWQQGSRHGHGELRTPDQNRYIGGFRDGTPWGVGTQEGPQGRYHGDWRGGLPDGVGTYESADGAHYAGGWSGGERSGFGTSVNAAGDTYEGEWAHDQPHGFGRLRSLAGLRYQGGWVEGRQHGFGRVERPDGSEYEGDWQDGMRHGQGREVAADGTIHDGRWEMNQPLGPGSRKDPTGIEIAGMWNRDTVSSGFLQLPSGLEYAGPLFSRAGRAAAVPLLEWLAPAAEAGDPHAQLLLGTLHLDLDEPRPDLVVARRWLSAAAGAGLAAAQYRLALTYRDTDAARAVDLLERAARQGHAAAWAALGDLHHAGIGVPQSFARAIEHYRQAVALGSSRARNQLAWLLATTPDARYRDGAGAVALIRPIALHFGNWQYLDTLAAAWAAAGDFAQAVTVAEEALIAARLAPEAAVEDVLDLEGRLEQFRRGRPYIDARPQRAPEGT